MARIFTIDFFFENINHTALVSSLPDRGAMPCHRVALQNEALQQLIPDGIICHTEVGANITAREKLMQCLLNAIARHLHAVSLS